MGVPTVAIFGGLAAWSSPSAFPNSGTYRDSI